MPKQKEATLEQATNAYSNLKIEDKMKHYELVGQDLYSILKQKSEVVEIEKKTIDSLKTLVLNGK